jgi:tetratricopeptide (TPR) repeat protein
MNFLSTAGRLISSRCRLAAARAIVPLLIVSAGLLVSVATTSAEETPKKYPFPLPPRTILERLGEMKLGEPPAIGAEEWQVLDAAWALRDAPEAEKRKPEFERLVVDALLTASGVTTDAARAEYREKLKVVVEGARAAVEKGKPEHPGESLMKFLHEGVMKGGYVAEQTSFADIFQSNKHNCVSATAMYYVVGRELGLEMRIIAIPGNRWFPGHACLDLIDGDKTYEVEPTNPDGFDWATKLSKPGVFTIGPQTNRKEGHFVDGLGLAASIYSNRGVGSSDVREPEKRDYLAAASLGLRALMCGPHEGSAAHNVTAAFTNWGPALAELGRYDDGVRALAFGIMATDEDDVWRNFHVTALEQIAELLKNKKDREAQAAIEFAATVMPKESDFQESTPWFRFANRRYEDEGGEAALAVVERALTTAPAADHEELRKHRTELLCRWSSSLLDKEDFNGALKLLVRAFKIDPTNSELHGSIAYHVQEALASLAKGGAAPAAAVAHYRVVLAEFPEAKVVGEMAIAHAQRTLSQMCDDKKYTEALATAAVYAPLAGTKDQAQGLISQVYSEWGYSFREQMNWTAAVEKYLEGLKVVPDSERLLSRALSAIDDWAEVSMKTNDWDAAIKVYDRGLVYLPNSGHLKNNREYCLSKKAEVGGK